MMLLNKTKCYGFSLSEVLLTLVIIGVVGAVLMPMLFEQTQKREYVIELKKGYSTINQVMDRIVNNSGYPRGDYTFLDNIDFIDEVTQVANTIKKCETIQECWNFNGKYKQLNNIMVTTPPNAKALIMADGMLYAFERDIEPLGLSEEDRENTLGKIMVDVNGQRRPNKLGLDTFVFYVVDGKGILPAGIYSTPDCSRSGAGWSCAGRVLRQNRITY